MSTESRALQKSQVKYLRRRERERKKIEAKRKVDEFVELLGVLQRSWRGADAVDEQSTDLSKERLAF